MSNSTHTRLDNLRTLAEQCQEVYNDEAKDALATGDVPRYALLTSEGGGDNAYADNPNLTVHANIGDLAEAIEGEASESPSWTPIAVVDLDTGAELNWRLRVEIEV